MKTKRIKDVLVLFTVFVLVVVLVACKSKPKTQDANEPIPLTKSWTNGNISESGGEQWFSYTAESDAVDILFEWDSLESLHIQAHNDSRASLGPGMSFSENKRWATFTKANVDQTYLFKVTSSGTGTYRIKLYEEGNENQ